MLKVPNINQTILFSFKGQKAIGVVVRIRNGWGVNVCQPDNEHEKAIKSKFISWWRDAPEFARLSTIDKAIKIQESNAISAQGGDLPYDRADYLRTAKILKTTRLNIEAQ